MEKTIYVAGGCYWGVQKYMDGMKGVLRTDVGFANGFLPNPVYEQVKHMETGYAETVRVAYDPDVLPLRALLRLFFLIIDPTLTDRQGEDVGHQYRTGVYWSDPADEAVIRSAMAELAAQYDAPIVTEAQALENYYTAEEYHQKYLDKTPGGYCHVPFDKLAWITTVDPADYAD